MTLVTSASSASSVQLQLCCIHLLVPTSQGASVDRLGIKITLLPNLSKSPFSDEPTVQSHRFRADMKYLLPGSACAGMFFSVNTDVRALSFWHMLYLSGAPPISGAGAIASLSPYKVAERQELSAQAPLLPPGLGSSLLTSAQEACAVSFAEKGEVGMISARVLVVCLSRLLAPGWLRGPENQRRGLGHSA